MDYISEKKYWENFYSIVKIPDYPSSFAEFIQSNYKLNENRVLLELGCGNGRDIIYFAKKNPSLRCIGIDQCTNVINHLSKVTNYKNLTFVASNFTSLNNHKEKIDYIYSRFTMHSIKEDEEDRLLLWLKRNTQQGGIFFVEARSTKDPIIQTGVKIDGEKNAYMFDHYRRFLEFDVFKDKLINVGFEILFSIESNNLAIYKDDNPFVIRIVARKL